MARDATTGELIWAYNIVPADPWDMDQPLITPLVDLNIGGQMRQTAIKAARNGYFYVWDRNTGELLIEPWPFVYNNIMTGVDMNTGRALYNIDKWMFTNAEDRQRYTQAGVVPEANRAADYTGTEVEWCPGIAPRNWQNDAYSPRTGLLYTATNTTCQRMIVIEGTYTPGEGYRLRQYVGTAQRALGADGVPVTHVGELQANDPVNARNAWRVLWPTGNQMPVMATATDLLFQAGDASGVMRALNATNGEIAWEFRTGSRFNQTPITYLGPDARQYIAIIASSAAANGAVAANAAPDNANRYRRSGSTLYVWALPRSVAGN